MHFTIYQPERTFQMHRLVKLTSDSISKRNRIDEYLRNVWQFDGSKDELLLEFDELIVE
jgi:hypothetical protein